MDNGRRGAVDELEVRRPSEGYELWRNMRLISSIAAKRLSSTEFISHKNNREKRGRALKTDPKLDGGRISDELKILMNVDASNNLADDANA